MHDGSVNSVYGNICAFTNNTCCFSLPFRVGNRESQQIMFSRSTWCKLPTFTVNFASSMLSRQSVLLLKIASISISDDGKMWNCLLTVELPGDAYGQVIDQTMNLFISEDVNKK